MTWAFALERYLEALARGMGLLMGRQAPYCFRDQSGDPGYWPSRVWT